MVLVILFIHEQALILISIEHRVFKGVFNTIITENNKDGYNLCYISIDGSTETN